MTDDQETKLHTQTKEHEPVFVVGMLRVRYHPSMFVEKGSPSFFEGDAVLLLVGAALPRIPLEADVAHADSVNTT
jgi:hypothetical protein